MIGAEPVAGVTALHLITLTMLGVGSISDLKNGVVYDWMPTVIAAAGIITYTYTGEIVAALFFGLCYSVFAYLTWRVNVWRDGDAFLMASLGFALLYDAVLYAVLLIPISTVYVVGWKKLRGSRARYVPVFLLTYLATLGIQFVI